MSGESSKRSFRRCRKITAFLCLIGFCLSYYALYVELEKAKDPNYKALCDISETMSCSKVFTSEYGTGFGILGKIFGKDHIINQPNGLYGAFMYPIFLFCSLLPYSFFATLGVILGTSGLIISVYLGYILFYILEDTCVVCITTYVVNFLLFITALFNRRAVKKSYEDVKPYQDLGGLMDGKTKKRV